jgi:uncharacterized NAD-dependent epimerase/dehydratase family protein
MTLHNLKLADADAVGALSLPQPYLLFLGDATELGYAKTAAGLRDWAGDKVVGEFASSPDAVTLGLDKLTPAEARAKGARSLVIGIANAGGFIDDSWVPSLLEALEAGLDIVSGMHTRLASNPQLKAAAERLGRRLIDVRSPPANIPVGTGYRRPGKRLLTVGTDCALGKKYTALALAKAFQARGVDADFRATGQTGIMIAGGGVPMDTVVADFAAGAAEMLSPAAARDHWDVVEGQGSLFHPSFAGVSLGLLHGAQPDAFVVCHEPTRTRMRGVQHPLPSIADVIDLTVRCGRLTNPAIRCVGIAINTEHLNDVDAARTIAAAADAHGLPASDPIRFGLEPIVDEIERHWPR